MKLNRIALIFLTIFAFIVRMIHLNYPEGLKWDEIYQVGRARMMLSSQGFLSNHPPFGKSFIMLGILIFGDNEIGWRIIQAVVGTLLVPLSYFIAKKLFTHRYAGLLTAFFITFDLLFLTYSRTGLVDIFLVFFIALSFLLFVIGLENESKISLSFYLSAVMAGLTASIKWNGLILIPILFLWLLTKKIKLSQRFIFIFATITALTYLSTFLFEGRNFKFCHEKYNVQVNNPIQSIASWHKLALKHHLRKDLKHYDESKWYTWPFMYKPVWIHFKVTDKTNMKATCIVGLGNPIIWWLGIIAVLFQLYMLRYKKDKVTIFLLGAYFISLLAYIPISRPMFLYHYMPALFFLFLILEKTFVTLYSEVTSLRLLLKFCVLLIILTFFYFYPFVNAYPITQREYTSRLWFESWKYAKEKNRLNW